jgi:cyclopropane fatty-acyl-phospholipid synthase-like methyltransferase
VVRLAEEGLLGGAVLDAGCGTGENALYLAGRGADVVGVDFVPSAVERARAKASDRGVRAYFLVHDALHLRELGRCFDAVLDCGLFHTFEDEERPRYADSVAGVLRAGGALHLLCFSEQERSEGGPRRVTQAEIREAFREGFRVEWIRPEVFESRSHPEGARAWVARVVREPEAT